MKAPTFEQVSPWAMRYANLAAFCCKFGAANNIALMVVRPKLALLTQLGLMFWWVPIALANIVLMGLMVRWAKLRLREIRRKYPEFFD
jgi:CBS-domain-containing membrane protein